jgi:hypothetical protein
MPTFIPGLELSGRYYAELVRPLLDRHFPNLPQAAALLGYGSEVLGFDTPMSMDHAWAPRLLLFLRPADLARAPEITALLARELPTHFLGFPLGVKASESEPGIFFMDENPRPGAVAHRVILTSLDDFVRAELDWTPSEPLTAVDWLTFPSQKLRSLTAGQVYFDSLGELTALRERLAWYPREVWLYLLASAWARIGEEEHLMPRAGFAGDELGSALIGSRLVRDVISLAFLLEKQYAPYPKWFGTAFQRLACAPELAPQLWQAQIAPTWPEREQALCAAYQRLAQLHNALGLTEPLPETVSSFHGRPFRVIHAEVFAEALQQQIRDPEVRRLAEKGLIGNLDQLSDNTTLRSDSHWRQALKAFYAESLPGN